MEEEQERQDGSGHRMPWMYHGLLVVPAAYNGDGRRWSCRTGNGRVLNASSKSEMKTAIREHEDGVS